MCPTTRIGKLQPRDLLQQKLKNIKFIKENLGGNLQDLRLGKEVFRQGIKSTNYYVRVIDKLDFDFQN